MLCVTIEIIFFMASACRHGWMVGPVHDRLGCASTVTVLPTWSALKSCCQPPSCRAVTTGAHDMHARAAAGGSRRSHTGTRAGSAALVGGMGGLCGAHRVVHVVHNRDVVRAGLDHRRRAHSALRGIGGDGAARATHRVHLLGIGEVELCCGQSVMQQAEVHTVQIRHVVGIHLLLRTA